LRDNLSHFSPKGWLIEKDLTAEATPPLSNLIAVIQDCSWASMHLDTPGVVRAIVDVLPGELPNTRGYEPWQIWVRAFGR
jgi:hypothetical protein